MISTTTIGSKEEPWPMVENPWDFFSEKGTKTVFLSIGTGSSCLPELDFCETLGCPVLKLDTPEVSQAWDDVKEVLKVRKITDATSEFAKPAARKWVLPKNIHTESCVPGFYTGSVAIDGKDIPVKPWFEVVQAQCKRMGLPEDQVRLDVLKIDNSPFESSLLESLWQSGFRPSLLLLNWTSSPDSSLNTLLSAGHLQMLGYALIAKEGTRYLYYFTDVNYYETCSWETPAKRFENPLMKNMAQSIYKGSEGVSIQFPLAK
jgi:hypothetical protein